MFLYFCPHGQPPPGYAEAGEPRDLAGPGPSGQPGRLHAHGRTPAYYPDRQTWRQIPGSDCWVGWTTGEAISPDEMLRDDAMQGHAVELADGRKWLVPVARAWSEEDAELRWAERLPMTAELDDAGRWQVGRVVGRYAALWDVASRFFESIYAGGKIDDENPGVFSFEFDDLIGAAVQVLAVNYRVGPVELSVLGAMSDAAAIAVMQAAVDWPTFVAWHAKKVEADAGSNTGDGVSAETEATAQPSPT